MPRIANLPKTTQFMSVWKHKEEKTDREYGQWAYLRVQWPHGTIFCLSNVM